MDVILSYQNKECFDIHLPCSKSYLHRYLILGAMCERPCLIHGVDFCEDTMATKQALEALGASFELNGTTLKTAKQKQTQTKPVVAHVKQSGSTLRFLIPYFASQPQGAYFKADASLLKRPLDIYEHLFNDEGLCFEKRETELFVRGSLKSGVYEIDGSVSSQFLTGLLLYLPFLEGDSKIVVKGELASFAYIQITLETLKTAGIQIEQHENEFIIKGSQKVQPFEVTVEKDYSSAAYFAILGALIEEGIVLEGLRKGSLQADEAILDYLEQSGTEVTWLNQQSVRIAKGSFAPIRYNIDNCIDLGPAIFAYASMQEGRSCFEGVKRLIYKESNRLKAMKDNLARCNVNLQEENDCAWIDGCKTIQPVAPLSSYQDHRIVMACSLLAMKSEQPIRIQNADVVRKSFGNFFEELKKCGFQIEWRKG